MEILWKKELKIPFLCPPVAGDGAIYLGSSIKRVYELDAYTGEKLGKLWVDVPVEDGLAFYDNHLAITGRSVFNRMKVYDIANGQFVWDMKSDRIAASPIACEKKVFVSTDKGSVYALDIYSGDKIWNTRLKNAVIEHELAFRDSLVFVVDQNGRLFCMESDSGKIRWELDLPERPVGPPVVIPDHVFVPTYNGIMPIITLSGEKRVTVESPGELIAPVVCSGPSVYGVTRYGIVFAGDLGAGGIMWQVDLDSPVIAPPVLWGYELVVIDHAGKISLVRAYDGEIMDEMNLSEPVTTGPIIYDRILYVVTESGTVYAIDREQNRMENENG